MPPITWEKDGDDDDMTEEENRRVGDYVTALVLARVLVIPEDGLPARLWRNTASST